MKHRLSIITFSELCQLENIESDFIIEIVEYGIVKPVTDSQVTEWEFETSSVHWIKKAVRLYQDLELDWLAVSLLIDLMKQRDTLQKENKFFQRQLHRFTQ